MNKHGGEMADHLAFTYVGLRRKSSFAKRQRLGLRRYVAVFNDATRRVVPKRGRVRALPNVN